VVLDLSVQALTSLLHFRAFFVPMHQIRTEQIEFVIQSHELTHQFVLHLALHQFIVPSYSYLDFVFHRVFARRKPHFNFRVTYPADHYGRHPVGCLQW